MIHIVRGLKLAIIVFGDKSKAVNPRSASLNPKRLYILRNSSQIRHTFVGVPSLVSKPVFPSLTDQCFSKSNSLAHDSQVQILPNPENTQTPTNLNHASILTWERTVYWRIHCG